MEGWEIEVDNPEGVLDLKFRNRFMNAWINPQGDIYEVNYMGHEEFAGAYIYDFNKEYEKEFDLLEWTCEFHDYLEYKGWLRIMTWETRPPRAIHGHRRNISLRITKRQKDSLFDLCMKYDSDLYASVLEA